MRLKFTLFLFALLSFLATSARAEPPPHLTAALELWKLAASEGATNLFDSIKILPVTGEDAPLARYKPESGGSIEIGQNLRQYRRDYAFLSSNQEKPVQPDFEQYLAILTALSLANESTHALQDRNGSLHDFYEFYNHAKLQEACALYGLQQYASDIVMMEFAVRLEKLFLGHGSAKGINALRIALEKNGLRDEFEEFREGLKSNDAARLNSILHIIKNKRNDANMAGMKFCDKNGDALVDQSIIDRATEPARNALSPETKKKSDKKIFWIFNQ